MSDRHIFIRKKKEQRLNRATLLAVMFAVLLATGSIRGWASEVLVGVGGPEETAGAPSAGQNTDGSAAGDLAESVRSEAGQPESATADDAADDAADHPADEQNPDEAWMLLLVNRDHPIPEDYEIPELTMLARDHAIDSRAYPALQSMFDDARAVGLNPYITSSFRTQEKQQQLMDDKIQEYIVSGYSQEDARTEAEKWVAIPGTSEHQLGLSVDISVDPLSGEDPGAVWYWLNEHCWEYGFIRRYPEEKTQITGISNEPWHFRYVGTEAAAAMHESGQCLEEYLGVA